MELPDFYPRPGGTSESMPNLQDPLESQIFRSDVFSNFPFRRPCRVMPFLGAACGHVSREDLRVDDRICGYVLNPVLRTPHNCRN
jgi:hypothetical protein